MKLLYTDGKLCRSESVANKYVGDGWTNFAATRTASTSGYLSETVTKGDPGQYSGDNTILMLHVVDSCLAWRLIQLFNIDNTWWRVHAIKFCVPQAASPVGQYILFMAEYSVGLVYWTQVSIAGDWWATRAQYTVA